MIYILMHEWIIIHFFPQQINITNHTQQLIIKVMSNTACKLTDGQHFFHMAQLLFHLLSFGYIQSSKNYSLAQIVEVKGSGA